jgi:hypothetical protein
MGVEEAAETSADWNSGIRVTEPATSTELIQRRAKILVF